MVEIIEVLEKLNPWWKGKYFETDVLRPKYLDKIKKFLTHK